jgi:maleylpyruvate isomerase
VRAPAADIEGVRLATRSLLRTIDDLTDAQAARGSLLPEWTRAEVLTHIARNADGFRRLAEGAARGDIGTQYPGGAEERAADIAAGRGVGAAALRSDVRRASDALMEAWRELPEDAWQREGKVIDGSRTIAHTVWARWREVELHHLDLDLGYQPSDSPIVFVRRALCERVERLGRSGQPRGGDRSSGAACYRIEASDHGRSWTLSVGDSGVSLVPDNSSVAVDATVSGWGCDLLAWLYGRDAGAELEVTGTRDVLQVPQRFPFD